MTAVRLHQAELIARLREMRLRAAHLRLAEARRETARAVRLSEEAEAMEKAAAGAVTDRRALLATRPERADALLLLLACAREDHGAAVGRSHAAQALLVERHEGESRLRQAVVRDEARRAALAGRAAELKRSAARLAEEAAACEAEENWRPG